MFLLGIRVAWAGVMNRFLSAFILLAALLSAVGCASYDDTAERAEFEKLRNRPLTPQGDRVLPSLESSPASDDLDSQRFAFGAGPRSRQ